MKIGKLTLKNFKFFYGEETLDFEGKNVLLYGENGSGKSSIYAALYTLLNNAKSPNIKIQNYFNHREKNRLLNRYIEAVDTGRISITLVDGEEYAISNDNVDIIQYKRGTTIKEASIASDFINYKLLAKLYDFKHSQTIDLFELFESDIFSYLTYDTHRNYDNVWDGFLKKEKTAPRKWSNEYMTFIRNIDSFNTKLNTFLDSIIESTNTILQEHFYSNLKISFTYRPLEYDSNHDIPRYRDLINPKINITISLLNDNIPIDANRKIEQPHTFLNEAKLTAIALSIRLAILRTRISADVLKILVLDDLLISLDMSNREIVANMLIEDDFLKDYQIIMLTHDRAFFEMAKQKFDSVPEYPWNFFEMYINDEGDFEKPYLQKSLNYFEKAEKYFREYDYSACANYLRKEVERIKKLKAIEESVGVPVDRSMRIIKSLISSDDFTNFSRPATTNDTCIGRVRGKLIGIKHNLDQAREPTVEIDLKDIASILQRILHPQSHDDTSRPLYKKELEEAIEIIQGIRDTIPTEG